MGGDGPPQHPHTPQQNTTPGTQCFDRCLDDRYSLNFLSAIKYESFSPVAYQPPAASQNYHYEPEPVRQAAAAPPPSSGVINS